MKPEYAGNYTAVITPFAGLDNTDKIDFNKSAELIRRQFSAGIDGVVIAGSTGEGAHLTQKEVADLVCQANVIATDEYENKKIIAGVSNQSVNHTIENMESVVYNGADAAMVMAPAVENIIKYFQELNRLGVPIIVYNNPERTGRNITMIEYSRLMEMRHIVAIKESEVMGADKLNPQMKQLNDLRKSAGFENSVAILSGDDEFNFRAMNWGADGFISVISNLVPDVMAQFRGLMNQGGVMSDLKNMSVYSMMDGNPQSIKFMMFMADLIRNYDVRGDVQITRGGEDYLSKKQWHNSAVANIR